MFVCNEKHADSRTHFSTGELNIDALPTIYFVTPTYPRREQIAEITRLGQTLMHIPKLHWIVADDYDACNMFLDQLLQRFGKFLPKKKEGHKSLPKVIRQKQLDSN